MERILLGDRGGEWDDFARQSKDGWFWHTTQWMDFTKAISCEAFRANLSFSIAEQSQTLAICPVLVEQSSLVADAHQLSYSGGPIPFPAMDNSLTLRKRHRVLKFYVQTLASLAREAGAGHVSVRVPAVAEQYLMHGMPFVNPLLEHGFIDLPYLTHIIDLRKDVDVLWRDVRKGHKCDVRSAEQACEANIWDQHTVTTEKFREYQMLHKKDAGRVTRSQRTFDLMLSWVKQGQAILVEAQHKGQAVGFSLIILFRNGAYYGSSCKDPDQRDISASHLIQWYTIKWLKQNHYDWYDIGLQHFCPQWFDSVASKDISISLFKRGFGGSTIPLVTAEFFYSRDLLKRVMEERWQSYLATHSPSEKVT